MTPDFSFGFRFSDLPFFDKEQDLILPTNLNPHVRGSHQDISRTFTLTVEQANMLAMNRRVLPSSHVADGSGPRVEFKVSEILNLPILFIRFILSLCLQHQLLLRFALSTGIVDGSTQHGVGPVVDDCYPNGLIVRVNGKQCILPPALPAPKGSSKDGFRIARPVSRELSSIYLVLTFVFYSFSPGRCDASHQILTRRPEPNLHLMEPALSLIQLITTRLQQTLRLYTCDGNKTFFG